MTFTRSATCWCRAISGRALYRGLTALELEREYSPSSCVGGDITPFIERYVVESERARRECRVLQDVRYGSGREQVLDLFLPRDAKDAPLHVFIHGGYWQELSHRESAVMAPALLERGFAHAVINYTLAPEATIDAMVEECRLALTWLHEKAGGHELDRDAISLSGHSAGAHLSAMLLSEGRLDMPLVGALLISGIYELEPLRHTSVNEPLHLTAEDCARLSPLALRQRTDVPVRLIVGANETSEFHRQTKAFAAHLDAQGADVRSEILAGLNHFDIICSSKVIEAVCGFHD